MNTEVMRTPIQKITLPSLPDDGLILDIGGGGEGIVSRIWCERVCAVDIHLNKIRQAYIYPVGRTNWFVCDGAKLCFEGGAFGAVSLWFSLAYMQTWNKKKAVIREAYRALSTNGVLSVLGAEIGNQHEKHILRVRFELPDGTISQTGYGLMGNQTQTLGETEQALREAGFSITNTEEHAYWFRIDSAKDNGT
ncbi:MAG: class I SAM-dependent methyltransferase [Candidatus Thorarchaeota archaeon]